ncbi:Retrovirus-related Pol polyprotein from transposon 17.6 [Vitis vinifera]|uniref:Retrovirus-related Pol polyprotein from transposon 17.6 n=1 Tax=Vitis vinifera TaxID=29760 RepID=A0A438D9E6_VITVI|nr:Retrovirus-related Pol polyprotein from transposon 17.6 [Vitis vinifera]
MRLMEILTTQVGGIIQISSWKARATQYQQPDPPSQQSSSLEQAMANLSKKPTPKPHVEKEEEEIKKGDEMEDKEKEISEKKKDSDSTMNAIPKKELLKEEMLKKSTSPPFPQALHGKKGIRNASEILEVLRQVKVNIPLQDMIKQVQTYAKFLKDLCTIKRGLTVKQESLLTEQVSAILQCKSPLKYKDPGRPTISIMIGGKVVEKALLDLGENRSVKIPRGVIEDVLVQVDNSTIRNGLMQLTFGNMTLDLNIFYMSKKQTTPEEEEGPEELCIIDTLVEEHCNQNIQDKLNESLVDFEEGIIYPISDSPWVSPTQVVPKKSGITVVQNEKGEEITTRLTSGYFHIEIDVADQEKTTFTCPFGTYAYRRMPFGLCNAPATFQRCMLSIFSDMVERIMEVFMDDITVYGGTFEECLINLEAVLHKCIEKDLVLNWEKYRFMVHQGIVLGHIISEKDIEVDKAKVELIVKLPSPTTVKGVRQFLGHTGFYRRFIKGFSSLSKPLCELLAKDAKFIWDERCQNSFDQLKKFLTTTPIVRALNWQLPFELMCDASDFAIGAVLGQREDGEALCDLLCKQNIE